MAAGEFFESGGGGGFHRVLGWGVFESLLVIEGFKNSRGGFVVRFNAADAGGNKSTFPPATPGKSGEIASPSVTDWRQSIQLRGGREEGVQE